MKDIDKMKDKDMDKNKEPPAPPKIQIGELMWESGYYYTAENFTPETTKPIIIWIIENNLMGAKDRKKNLR